MASEGNKKKVLLGVAVVVILGAGLLLFRDSLFSGGADAAGPALDSNTAEAIQQRLGDTAAEPPPEVVRPAGSGKRGS